MVGEQQCKEMKSKRFSPKHKGILPEKVMSELPSFLLKVYSAHAQAIWLGSAKVHPGFALLFLESEAFRSRSGRNGT